MSQGNNMFAEEENEWVIDVTGRITDIFIKTCKPGSGYSGVTINRVPKFLVFLRKEAYTPRVVRLGLFHHVVARSVSHMDRLKAEAVERMAHRLPKQDELSLLQETVGRIVCEIRSCYEEEFAYRDDTVALIFTLDGCFVLEILKVLSTQHREHYCHPIFNANRIRSCQFDVLSDFLMLENQIPMMVLIKLMEMETGSEAEAKKELLRLLCTSIIPVTHPFLPNGLDGKIEARLKKFEDLEKHKHILGLFQSLIIEDPRDPENTAPSEGNKLRLALRGFLWKLNIRSKQTKPVRHQTLIVSAKRLHKEGMKFSHYDGVPSKEKMTFKNRTLSLPTIWINDSTEVILRNLLALEVYQGLTVISYYVYLLNSLVESDSDVAVLRKAEIIQSTMSTDKEVAQMLNNICKGINFNSSDDPFMDLKVMINARYRRNILIRIREYQHRHPMLWRNISIFWGLLLLVSAAIPTLISIWQKIV